MTLREINDVLPKVFRESYLGIDGLILLSEKERGEDPADNPLFFKIDYVSGILKQYEPTAVLYWKGNLVGQSKNGQELYDSFCRVHGQSNAAVFVVPTEREDLEKAIKEAIGLGR